MNATRTNRMNRFGTSALSPAYPAPAAVQSVHALEADGVLAIEPEGRSLRLLCDHGQVWVTQAGDSRDVILSPGVAFTSTGTGKIVVQALEPARFLVSLA